MSKVQYQVARSVFGDHARIELQGAECYACDQPATRMFCYAAEPWTPYCREHPPQYETAGDTDLKPRTTPPWPAPEVPHVDA